MELSFGGADQSVKETTEKQLDNVGTLYGLVGTDNWSNPLKNILFKKSTS